MKISLAGPSYTAESVVAAAQQTINWYPETLAVGDEPRRQFLIGRPGLKLFATLTPAKVRCLWAGGGRLFVIHGNTLSELKENGTHATGSPRTNTLAQGAGSPDPAQIFANGNQLMIVSGGLVYVDGGTSVDPARFGIYGVVDTDGTTTVYWTSSMTTPETSDLFVPAMEGKVMRIGDGQYVVTNFINDATIEVNKIVPTQANAPYSMDSVGDQVTAVTGGFLDGYGIVNRPPAPPGPGTATRSGRRNKAGVEAPADIGRQFNYSALNDFSSWNPADFGVKEGHPDYIRSILCDHEELWLLGTETTEVWSNIGDPNSPFQRMGGAFIHGGSVATYAPCSVGLTVCALGGTPDGQTVAYQMQGLQPQRISTYGQEQVWNAPGFNARDAVSHAELDGGHLFWVVNFWAEQQTWVYDLTERLWHQRYAWNAAGSSFTRYQPWFHVFIPEWGAGGKHIVADPATGKLYEQSLDFHDDDGTVIQYLRAFPHLLDENKNLFHHRFELYMETGTIVAPNPEMSVGLDWSNDRGHTFPVTTWLQTSGATGNFTKRIVWRRLGRSRDRVYRVGVQGKAKVALIDAFLEATPGAT